MSAPFFPFAYKKSPRQTKGLTRISWPPCNGQQFAGSVTIRIPSLIGDDLSVVVYR
jgi:hypothetical protein